VVMACLAVVAPTVLEWTGAIVRQYHFVEGGRFVSQGAVVISAFRARVALLVTALASIAGTSLVLWHFSAEDMQNRRKLQLLVWHLKQLAPQRTSHHSEPPLIRGSRPAT